MNFTHPAAEFTNTRAYFGEGRNSSIEFEH